MTPQHTGITWTVATVGTALGCGMIGGVFFAFSTFIMDALGRLQPAAGIRAMQSVNVAVINPVFLGALLGTAVLCAVLTVLSVRSWSEPGSPLRVAGCALYLVGTIAVTFACHVPRNDALAALQPDAADAAATWARYLSEWTGWNHVRMLAALAASALVVAAQLVRYGVR